VSAARELDVSEITAAVEKMVAKGVYVLGERELEALRRARQSEVSPLGCAALDDICRNAEIAAEGVFPICQDTGLAVFFVFLGRDVRLVGGSLQEAVDEGVRRAQKGAYIRASVVSCPFKRVNTADNTPAVVHTTVVDGDRLRIFYDAKGGGSENMSRLAMLKPADGINGLVEFAVTAVKEASANPCPPVVVGLAAGGNFEKVALMAKWALLRPLGDPNHDADLAAIERRVLQGINDTGVGPSGLGGRVTALAVHLETAPCHIASLPVAINIDCHAHRHQETEL